MADENIGNLTYTLGAIWDKKSLDNIKSGFDTLAKGFAGTVATVGTALGGAFAATKEVAEYNDELGKLAANRNIAVGSLQSIQQAFEFSGVSGEKAGDVLAKLQKKQGEFARGKTASARAFAEIGVNPTAQKDTEALFKATVDGLNNIKDEAKKAQLAEELLGSKDLGNLIAGGSAQFDKIKQDLQDQGALISDEDTQNSAVFNDTLLETTTILKGAFNKVFSSLIPVFTDILAKFNSFLKANRAFIQGKLATFIKTIVNLSKKFVELLARTVDNLGGIEPIAIAIGAALAIWQAPLLLAVGTVLALLLIFDDLMAFIKGESSVIGDFLAPFLDGVEQLKTEFPNLTQIIEGWGNAVKSVVDLIIGIFENLFNLIFGEDSISAFFDKTTAKIGDFVDEYSSAIGDVVGGAIDAVAPIFGGGEAQPTQNSAQAQPTQNPAQAQPTQNPAQAQSPQNITTNNQPTTSTIINVSNINATDKSINQVLGELNSQNGNL